MTASLSCRRSPIPVVLAALAGSFFSGTATAQTQPADGTPRRMVFNLKFAPDIRFRADERFDEAERIEKLLRTPAVQRDIDNKPDET